MPYVRAKGNQLCIVHGERDPSTKEVRQRVLFTLYSQAEALAALGGGRDHFRRVVESENPGVKIDWREIDAGINEQLEILPEVYSYRDRDAGTFRESLAAFTKELLVNDPQNLLASARLLQAHRHELEYLRELIEWRLKLCEQGETKWNEDTPFHWRSAMWRREVPPETWEEVGELYGKGEHEKCAALAKLLTEAWPNFAAGHNYLGLIARDRGALDEAVGHFERALVVGRTLFPKRIRKDEWWGNHDTRPYIRSLVWLAQTHNRRGDQGKALVYCDRLEKECAQDITAATERGPIFLNAGLWEPAMKAARYVVNLYRQESFALGFALHEMGEQDEGTVYLLHGALKYPRTARMLVGMKTRTRPASYDEVEDHNTGVDLGRDIHQYLIGKSRGGRAFLKKLIEREAVVALIDEAETVRLKWHEERGTDRKWFDRMTEMSEIEFARSQAKVLFGAGEVNAKRKTRPIRLVTRGPLEAQ